MAKHKIFVVLFLPILCIFLENCTTGTDEANLISDNIFLGLKIGMPKSDYYDTISCKIDQGVLNEHSGIVKYRFEFPDTIISTITKTITNTKVKTSYNKQWDLDVSLEPRFFNDSLRLLKLTYKHPTNNDATSADYSHIHKSVEYLVDIYRKKYGSPSENSIIDFDKHFLPLAEYVRWIGSPVEIKILLRCGWDKSPKDFGIEMDTIFFNITYFDNSYFYSRMDGKSDNYKKREMKKHKKIFDDI